MSDVRLSRDEFTRLYEAHAPALHAWARWRIPASLRGTVAPEDIVQEAWWRAIEGIDRFDPARGSFRAWIFRVALNVVLESARRERPRNRQDPSRRDPVSPLPSEVIAEATSISLRASRSEKAQEIVAALAGLDDADRQLLLYCGFEGLSTTEVAEICGLGGEACRKRWLRLRQRLAGLPVWAAILE